MYDETSKTPAWVRSGELNTDLGQIEYIFSDKNGTLTENKLKFRMCSIKGRVFGHPKDTVEPCELYENYKDFVFHDPHLLEEAKSNMEVNNFIEILALCHTVIT